MPRKWWRSAAVLATVLIASAGCGAEGQPDVRSASTSQTSESDWRADVIRFADSSGAIVAPQQLPANLVYAQGAQLGGQPALTFSSTGEPIVVVCSGDVARCRAQVGRSTVLRHGTSGSVPFVVALQLSEYPGAPER